MPVLAVSASRISPTMITSGSARMKLRMAAAKVQPILGLTCTWRRPAWTISIGSSAVQIFRSAVLSSRSRECSVVVFPEPVGPQTRKRPCGREIRRFSCLELRGVEAQSVERDRRRRGEHAHHDVFQPAGGRDGGHAQIDVERAEAAELDLAVLGLAPLGDVELRHDLQARDHRLAELGRQVEVGDQRAVLAEAHAHVLAAGVRLDVDVGGLLLDGVDDHLVDQLHQRVVLLERLRLVEVAASAVSAASRWVSSPMPTSMRLRTSAAATARASP